MNLMNIKPLDCSCVELLSSLCLLPGMFLLVTFVLCHVVASPGGVVHGDELSMFINVLLNKQISFTPTQVTICMLLVSDGEPQLSMYKADLHNMLSFCTSVISQVNIFLLFFLFRVDDRSFSFPGRL